MAGTQVCRLQCYTVIDGIHACLRTAYNHLCERLGDFMLTLAQRQYQAFCQCYRRRSGRISPESARSKTVSTTGR